MIGVIFDPSKSEYPGDQAVVYRTSIGKIKIVSGESYISEQDLEALETNEGFKQAVASGAIIHDSAKPIEPASTPASDSDGDSDDEEI